MIRHRVIGIVGTFALLLYSAAPTQAEFTISVGSFDFSGSGFDAAKQTLAQDLFTSAMNTWTSTIDAPFGKTIAVNITKVVFGPLDAGTNGSTSLGVDAANGFPGTVAEVDISNAANMFYSTTIAGIGATQRDAFSTMLHEVGHAVGFNIGYQKWKDRVTDTDFLLADGTTKVTLAGTSANGQSHVAASFATDLMNPTGAVKVRDSISALDIKMLSAAYGFRAVPEPASILMICIGGGFVAHVRRRRIAA